MNCKSKYNESLASSAIPLAEAISWNEACYTYPLRESQRGEYDCYDSCVAHPGAIVLSPHHHLEGRLEHKLASNDLRNFKEDGQSSVDTTTSVKQNNGEIVDTKTIPCQFFLRTGTCAFGQRCKFFHPPGQKPPELNTLGYPVRKEKKVCPFYTKAGWCAFGATCKFDHPILRSGEVTRISPQPMSMVGVMPTWPMMQWYPPALSSVHSARTSHTYLPLQTMMNAASVCMAVPAVDHYSHIGSDHNGNCHHRRMSPVWNLNPDCYYPEDDIENRDINKSMTYYK